MPNRALALTRQMAERAWSRHRAMSILDAKSGRIDHTTASFGVNTSLRFRRGHPLTSVPTSCPQETGRTAMPLPS